MENDGEPQAVVATADACEASTIFHAPMVSTATGTGVTELLGTSPESSAPRQVVVECTLTHWGWYCYVYLVCP